MYWGRWHKISTALNQEKNGKSQVLSRTEENGFSAGQNYLCTIPTPYDTYFLPTYRSLKSPPLPAGPARQKSKDKPNSPSDPINSLEDEPIPVICQRFSVRRPSKKTN
jgi:hypothetical protein